MKQRKGLSFLGVLCIVLAVLAIGFFIAGAALTRPKDAAAELSRTARTAAGSVSDNDPSGALSRFLSWLGGLGEKLGEEIDNALTPPEDTGALKDCSASETFDAADVAGLSIDLTLGDVELIPSEDGRIHVDYSCQLSESLQQRHSFSAVRTGSRVEITQSFGSRNLSANAKSSVRLTVALPAELGGQWRISTVSGKLSVGALTASSLEASSINGSISALRFACGSIKADTVNGAIDLTLAAAPAALTLESVNGSVRLGLPPASEFAYDLSNVNGELSLNGFAPAEIFSEEKHHKSGRVGENPADASVALSSVNGELELRTNR